MSLWQVGAAIWSLVDDYLTVSKTLAAFFPQPYLTIATTRHSAR